MDIKNIYLVLVCGGAMLLEKYFRDSNLTGEVILINDIFANVKGYEILSQMKQR